MKFLSVWQSHPTQAALFKAAHLPSSVLGVMGGWGGAPTPSSRHFFNSLSSPRDQLPGSPLVQLGS